MAGSPLEWAGSVLTSGASRPRSLQRGQGAAAGASASVQVRSLRESRAEAPRRRRAARDPTGGYGAVEALRRLEPGRRVARGITPPEPRLVSYPGGRNCQRLPPYRRRIGRLVSPRDDALQTARDAAHQLAQPDVARSRSIELLQNIDSFTSVGWALAVRAASSPDLAGQALVDQRDHDCRAQAARSAKLSVVNATWRCALSSRRALPHGF